MASFYLDNDLSDDLVPLLAGWKHDALTTRRRGQAQARDDQQLLTAFQLGRILVTHNARDFRLVHHAWRLWPSALGVQWPPHPGILVLPQPPALSIVRAAEELDRFVRSGRSIANELYRLTTAGFWLRER